jgi:DNA repair protein RadB
VCIKVLQRIPTGSKAVDRFLAGGIPASSVSLVYGEAQTGKTTIALQCAVSCASQGHKTLFVDCDGKFYTRRLSQIASAQYKGAVNLMILMRPKDFHEQTVIIDDLADYITKDFGLIVFDTITSLYRLRVSESPSKTFELNRELNRELAALAQVAKTQRIAVLLTSQVHSALSEIPVSIEPVATRVLKFWADTVIAIKPTQNRQIVRVTVEKNPAKLPPATYDLRIEEKGVSDCKSD